MYRQFDGYFFGMGAEIIEFIRHGKMVDGYPSNAKMGECFNGMGELACQLIAHFKRPHKDYNNPKKKVQTVGNFYIVPLDERNESFHYELGIRNGELYLTCDGYEVRDGYPGEGVRGVFELYPLTEENVILTKSSLIPEKKKGKVKKS